MKVEMAEVAVETLAQISDQAGLLILNDIGAVVSSHGDLCNDEKTANELMSMVNTTWKIITNNQSRKTDLIARLSVVFEGYFFTATVCNGSIYIVKRYRQSNTA